MKPRTTITILIILCAYFAIRAATAETQVERYQRKEARRKADEQRKAQERNTRFVVSNEERQAVEDKRRARMTTEERIAYDASKTIEQSERPSTSRFAPPHMQKDNTKGTNNVS